MIKVLLSCYWYYGKCVIKLPQIQGNLISQFKSLGPVVVSMTLACIVSYVLQYVVPTWWNCLGRIKKYGLIGGGVPLGVGLGVSRPMPFQVCSRLPFCGSKCEFSAVAPASCLPCLLSCSLPVGDGHLTLWNCNPNKAFLLLPRHGVLSQQQKTTKTEPQWRGMIALQPPTEIF